MIEAQSNSNIEGYFFVRIYDKALGCMEPLLAVTIDERVDFLFSSLLIVGSVVTIFLLYILFFLGF